MAISSEHAILNKPKAFKQNPSATNESDEADERSPFDKVTHHKKRMFLIALSEGGNQVQAARLSGVSRTVCYHWKRHDPDFLAAFHIAWELGLEVLESKAQERAMRDNFPSDLLTIFLLKGGMPHKYRERTSLELTGANGGPIQMDYTRLSDEQLATLEGLIALAQVRPAEIEQPAIEASSSVVEADRATIPGAPNTD